MLKISDSKLVEKIMRERRISQSELAKQIGVSRQFINKVLKGEGKFSHKTLSAVEALYPYYFTGEVSIGDTISREKFLEIRKQLHLSQAQLAEKLGMSSAIIACYEKGTRIISEAAVRKLKDLLDKDFYKVKYYSSLDFPCSPKDLDIKPECSITVDKRTVKRCNLNIDNSIAFQIRGKRYLPVFDNKDIIIADRSKTKPCIGAVCLVKLSDGMCDIYRVENYNPRSVKCAPLSGGSAFTELGYEMLGTIPRVIL